MYRPLSRDTNDLMTLYEEDSGFTADDDCVSEGCDQDSESSEEGKGVRGVRSSVSLEIYGLQRDQQVHFSNREYYHRLEELKRTHLSNMAELERMYISQGKERRKVEDEEESGRGRSFGLSSPGRRLQRINSQEELDFQDTLSGSDQSELSVDDSMSESWSRQEALERDILMVPVEISTNKSSQFQPKPSSPACRHSAARIGSKAKVTIPKPFQMMLREEDRKRHKVRTRSEIELENTLLKRELEELRECQKKFRASPAPPHVHLSLYEAISRRSTKRLDRSRSAYTSKHDARSCVASSFPKPFQFLERERRKREAKIVAELGNFDQKVEWPTFKARPMPSALYRRTGAKTSRSNESSTLCNMEREVTEGQSDPNSDLEPETDPNDSIPSAELQRHPSSKPAKKQIELSIEMVKEQDWIIRNTCNICCSRQQDLHPIRISVENDTSRV